MKSRKHRFLSLTTVFLSLILLHNPTIAKPGNNGFFTHFEGQRYLQVDLSSLKKGHDQVQRVIDHVQKGLTSSKFKNHDHFILSYLYALQENFEASSNHQRKIDPQSLSSLLAQYYWLHFWVRSTKPEQESQHNIKLKKHQLQDIQMQLPKALNPSIEATIDLFSLIELSKTDASQISIHFIDQTIQSFRFAKVSDRAKVDLLLQIHRRIQKKPTALKNAFYNHVRAHFDGFSKIRTILPPATQSTEEIKANKGKEEKAKQILEKAKHQLENNQKALAIQSWSRIFHNYPDTQSYQSAMKQVRAFLKKERKKSDSLDAFIPELTLFPPDTLYTEGRHLWNVGENMTAFKMFLQFVENYSFHEKAPNAHYILARIYENWGEFDKARVYYEKISEQYISSEFYQRALFKVGLLSFLEKDYKKAQEVFEEETKDRSSNLRQAQAHYWLYKTFKAKKEKSNANKHKDILLKKFPFTFYATIVDKHPQIEKKNAQFVINKSSNTLRIQEGIDLFLQLGLHNLVRKEFGSLDFLNENETFDLARKLNHKGFYLHSMNLMYDLLTSQQKLYPSILEVFFPIQPYREYFDPKKEYKIPNIVALSIMKQESAFNPLAVSPANAHGLLQLIMPTAKNMARKNSIQIRKWDLFTPKINILLGTTYVDENLKRFDNNLVDSLVAYNAGPNRAIRWRDRWFELDEDVFIEMIPIQETRTYVKLILRNIYFYKKLYPNEFKKTLDFKGLPEHFVK